MHNKVSTELPNDRWVNSIGCHERDFMGANISGTWCPGEKCRSVTVIYKYSSKRKVLHRQNWIGTVWVFSLYRTDVLFVDVDIAILQGKNERRCIDALNMNVNDDAGRAVEDRDRCLTVFDASQDTVYVNCKNVGVIRHIG